MAERVKFQIGITFGTQRPPGASPVDILAGAVLGGWATLLFQVGQPPVPQGEGRDFIIPKTLNILYLWVSRTLLPPPEARTEAWAGPPSRGIYSSAWDLGYKFPNVRIPVCTKIPVRLAWWYFFF